MITCSLSGAEMSQFTVLSHCSVLEMLEQKGKEMCEVWICLQESKTETAAQQRWGHLPELEVVCILCSPEKLSIGLALDSSALT